MILLISRSKFESWVRKVLLISIVSLLFSNSVNTRREKSMLYSRLTIIILLFTISICYDILSFKFLSKGIGIYQGLLHVNSVTIVFDIFICILSACILTLTSFKPHKILLDIKERNLYTAFWNFNYFYLFFNQIQKQSYANLRKLKLNIKQLKLI